MAAPPRNVNPWIPMCSPRAAAGARARRPPPNGARGLDRAAPCPGGGCAPCRRGRGGGRGVRGMGRGHLWSSGLTQAQAPLPSCRFGATGGHDPASMAEKRSAALERGLRISGAAGEAADADTAGPGGGACGRVVLAKVLPQFHPQPAECLAMLRVDQCVACSGARFPWEGA